MDSSEKQKDDYNLDHSNKKGPADDSLDQLDDTEDIVNTFSEYEPADIPGTDFVTGKDLIPLSKELVKCEESLASYGLFNDYDRNKVERKVLEMKETFMEGVMSTSNAPLFSDEDEWIAKGSAMEGNLFPALHELAEDEFKNKILGEDPLIESFTVLEEAIRDFKAKSNIRRYIIQLADIDIMVAPKSIHLSDEKWLIPTKHSNCYNINVNGLKNCVGLLDKTEHLKINGRNINTLCPYKLRNVFEESIKAMCFYNEKELTAMICAPHGLAFQIVKIRLVNETVTGDFYDLAFAVSCHFWPQSAREWIERRRSWPDKDDINQIMDGGVHLVAKSPASDMEELLWRLTFAKAEGIISALPLVHWYALRSWSLTKSFLQGFNIVYKPNILTSYHIKTLFLYALERMPVDYWINGENTVKTIVSIIDELIACIATQECQHYFTPNINLFESSAKFPSIEFGCTVAKQLRHEREKLVSDPLEYFFRGGHEIIAAEDGCDEISEIDSSTDGIEAT